MRRSWNSSFLSMYQSNHVHFHSTGRNRSDSFHWNYLLALSWRLKIPIKTGRGIYILYKDVRSCPCEDVHVLWSILVESHTAPPLAAAALPSK
ncbi:hypothetical protein Pyn_01448 [Prunus yedoensis var. nudiflora]|uniref:Uncharacterized protein n=1 Tax=Prunus yedoensis var. nudiflora TaxID=2094558 RepID=A0A314ZN48_PRUYE|nr:hypothetical protein Pyn_01448 [Prunus yedoensis var. nudiflora]